MANLIRTVIKYINTDVRIKFIFNIFILTVLFIAFYYLLRDIEYINNLYLIGIEKFSYFLLDASKLFLELFGYKTVTYGKTIRIIENLTVHGIYLDRGCMGRNVMLAFSGLILAAPGKFINKMWFIPAGLSIIIFINILRISGLALTAYCCKEYSDINHYFVFKIAAWTAIFIMWAIWFNKFAKFKKSKNLN